MNRREFIGCGFAALAAPQAAFAKCERRKLATCDKQDPWGHKYEGTQQMALPYCGVVRHPDFEKLDSNWYSYAILGSERQIPTAVRLLREGKQWREVVELPLGQASAQKCFKPGWVIMLVSPCRYPGSNVILVTNPLRASDNGKTFVFHELISGGKPVLV